MEFVACSLVAVILLYGASTCAQEEPRYHALMETLDLRPDTSAVPKTITSILWKHGDNMVAEWIQHTNSPVEYYAEFKHRTYLDIQTGRLAIYYLNGADGGVYSVEFNNILQPKTYKLILIIRIGALVGDDVILPFNIKAEVSAEKMGVVWTRTDLMPEGIHQHLNGRHVEQNQNNEYSNRTSLFVEQLSRGNVSLKLDSVKLSDSGMYHCFVSPLPENAHREATMELIVGRVDEPRIDILGAKSLMLSQMEVKLQCESSGWPFKPKVFWVDGETGETRGEGTVTKKSVVEGGLWSVLSTTFVKECATNNFTCSVRLKHIIREKTIHIQGYWISSQRLKIIHGFIYTAAAVTALAVVILPILCCYHERRRRTRGKHFVDKHRGELIKRKSNPPTQDAQDQMMYTLLEEQDPCLIADLKRRRHFVDIHREEIQRVREVEPIMKELQTKGVIDQERYNDIMSKPTPQDQMRELYTGTLYASGDTGKDIFREILQEHKDLMDNLKTKSSSGKMAASCCEDRHHRKLAICSSIFFPCTGIVAVINSVKASGAINPETADHYSRRARRFGIISLVLGLILLIFLTIPILLVVLQFKLLFLV